MAQLLHIHPQNPEVRLIKHAVRVLQEGGVLIYPTDSPFVAWL